MQPAKTILNFAAIALSKPQVAYTILKTRQKKLTYLGISALIDLSQAILRAEKQGTPGILIEAGCALGGSAIVMVAAKSKGREFRVYDTFKMIPPPSTNDGSDAHQRYEEIAAGKSAGIHGTTYYGYEEDLVDKVTSAFTTCGYPLKVNQTRLLQGLFQDTLTIDVPVALAHLDCDWYESVMTCLKRIAPQLSLGGVLVVDDYFHWSGCKKAVDEFFSDKQDTFKFVHKSRLHIIRVK